MFRLPRGACPLRRTLQGLEYQGLQELLSLLPLQSHQGRPPLQAASRAMDPLLQGQDRCTVVIMVIMENTLMAEDHILQDNIPLLTWIREHSSIIKTAHTGTEQILGMADIKGSPQVTKILTTSTESLNPSDPAPEPASILTDPHPGKAILKITTEQTEVPTVIIMQIMPSTMIMQDTTMDSMTRSTEDTMISLTGGTMTRATETTIINRCILPGKRATMISGDTILVMMPVLRTITADVAKPTETILTDTASTASSPHTACTAPTVTTADAAASALAHSRAKCTEASLI